MTLQIQNMGSCLSCDCISFPKSENIALYGNIYVFRVVDIQDFFYIGNYLDIHNYNFGTSSYPIYTNFIISKDQHNNQQPILLHVSNRVNYISTDLDSYLKLNLKSTNMNPQNFYIGLHEKHCHNLWCA